MASTGTGPGVHAAAEDRTHDTDSFQPDAASRYANFEQRASTLGRNVHHGEQPGAFDKAVGKVEAGLGKVIGDPELQAKGLASQGKADADTIQDLSYQNSASQASKAERLPSNAERQHPAGNLG
ncbi:uncharacterized protein JCM10292_001440 [Rhodotorula paludigena]|uniref:uncharacterized protein n=1 Tax=Rhodotorula paludigena TaxID=86838 RepID=UPI003174C43A